MNSDEKTDLYRRIRWRITVAEQSLDHAISAVTRANELVAMAPPLREEFKSDLVLLRGKLDRLAELLA